MKPGEEINQPDHVKRSPGGKSESRITISGIGIALSLFLTMTIGSPAHGESPRVDKNGTGSGGSLETREFIKALKAKVIRMLNLKYINQKLWEEALIQVDNYTLKLKLDESSWVKLEERIVDFEVLGVKDQMDLRVIQDIYRVLIDEDIKEPEKSAGFRVGTSLRGREETILTTDTTPPPAPQSLRQETIVIPKEARKQQVGTSLRRREETILTTDTTPPPAPQSLRQETIVIPKETHQQQIGTSIRRNTIITSEESQPSTEKEEDKKDQE